MGSPPSKRFPRIIGGGRFSPGINEPGEMEALDYGGLLAGRWGRVRDS